MVHPKKLSFIFIIILSGTITYAQKNVATQSNGWYVYTGNHLLTSKISLHTEYQWRRSEIITNWQQSLARIGVDFKTSDNSVATGGYGHIITFPYGKQPVSLEFTEHRIWEQLILTHKTGRFYFNHRYRVEQRWLDKITKDINNNPIKEGYTYKDRARYRFMVTIPLNNNEMGDKTFFLVLSDELFVNYGKSAGLNIFDQNRLYTAFGFRFNSKINVQVGYLKQYIQKASAIDREDNNTLQFALVYNLDFRKKDVK